MVRAAAYKANINEASVGGQLTGRRDAGLISPAMEKPLATKTFAAVINEARRRAFVYEEIAFITCGSDCEL
jgi:hypothetical protein